MYSTKVLTTFNCVLKVTLGHLHAELLTLDAKQQRAFCMVSPSKLLLFSVVDAEFQMGFSSSNLIISFSSSIVLLLLFVLHLADNKLVTLFFDFN